MTDVRARVRAFLMAELDVEAAALTDAATFTDLGMDSLSAMLMLSDLEHRFGLRLPDEQAQQLTTVGEIIACIEGLLTGAAQKPPAAVADPASANTRPWRQKRRFGG